jgi:RHS repeat-associated protein
LSNHSADPPRAGRCQLGLSTLGITGLPGGTSNLTNFTYDAAGRLSALTINGVNIAYTYLPNSNQLNEVTATVPGNFSAQGTDTKYLPDPADPARLSRLSASTGAVGQAFVETLTSNLAHPSNGYNSLGQLAGQDITRTDPNASITSDTFAYGYNANQGDALTSVTDSPGSGPGTTYAYGYDGVGNVTSSGINDVLTSMPYGTPNSLNQYAGTNYGYNSRGDVSSTNTYQIAWDASDRPITFTPQNPTVGSFKVQLGYDSQDRWVWKDVYTWTGTSWSYSYSRHAVWDGDTLLGETDGNNTLLKGYTWGPNGLAAITDYSQATPRTYIPVADYSGNIVELLDPISGAVAAAYRYDPYGDLVSSSGTAAGLCPFQGKGLYVHAEIPGIMFAGHRVTDGRIWLSRDPSGEGSDVNLYRLFSGDPINLNDQSGLAPDEAQQIYTPYVNRALEAISKDPKTLITSPRYNIASLIGRLVFYDAWVSADHAIDTAYSTARTDLAQAASQASSPGERAVYNGVRYATYPMQMSSQFASTYAQAEATGVGAVSRLRYVQPLAKAAVGGLTLAKGADVAGRLSSQAGRDSLTVRDFTELGLGAWGTYHLAADPNSILTPWKSAASPFSETPLLRARVGSRPGMAYIPFGRSAAQAAKEAALSDIADYYANEAEDGFTIDPAVPDHYLDPTNRPAYAAGQVEAVWEAAKDPTGKVYDPFTGEELTWVSRARNDQWHMGHIEGQEYWKIHAKLLRGDMSWREFLDWYRDPANYQPQSIPSNTSGRFQSR